MQLLIITIQAGKIRITLKDKLYYVSVVCKIKIPNYSDFVFKGRGGCDKIGLIKTRMKQPSVQHDIITKCFGMPGFSYSPLQIAMRDSRILIQLLIVFMRACEQALVTFIRFDFQPCKMAACLNSQVMEKSGVGNTKILKASPVGKGLAQKLIRQDVRQEAEKQFSSPLINER